MHISVYWCCLFQRLRMDKGMIVIYHLKQPWICFTCWILRASGCSWWVFKGIPTTCVLILTRKPLKRHTTTVNNVDLLIMEFLHEQLEGLQRNPHNMRLDIDKRVAPKRDMFKNKLETSLQKQKTEKFQVWSTLNNFLWIISMCASYFSFSAMVTSWGNMAIIATGIKQYIC